MIPKANWYPLFRQILLRAESLHEQDIQESRQEFNLFVVIVIKLSSFDVYFIDKCSILCFFLLVNNLAGLRRQLRQTQDEFAEKLGISRQHVSKLENSSGPLSAKLARRVAELSQELGRGLMDTVGKGRFIRVLSWAQAGVGIDYEELPLDWQRQVLTDCPDEKAFAVEIQGDSMEQRFSAGDIAVLMPSQVPRNNSLVVARLEREGAIFKIFTARGQPPQRVCSFTSYNPVYQPIEVPESSVVWNYPVYQTIRQVWR